MTRSNLLNSIKAHISEFGYHITTVIDSPYPRFMYTIGFYEIFGCELIFAGNENLPIIDVQNIIKILYHSLNQDKLADNFSIYIENLGLFNLRKVDSSWSSIMTLGVFDFYQKTDISVYQIIPTHTTPTIDMPDLSQKYVVNDQPIWKWLTAVWPYSVPKNATAITNVDTLYGQKVTEITRWEELEWEVFTRQIDEEDKDNLLLIPIGTLIGIDSTLEVMLSLEVGKGVWRDQDDLQWNEWE